MASSKTDDLIRFLISTAVDDGAVIIAPHREPFRPKERNFLDGIRNTPASISAPPGTNPFTHVLRQPGRWMFVWIPEK